MLMILWPDKFWVKSIKYTYSCLQKQFQLNNTVMKLGDIRHKGI